MPFETNPVEKMVAHEPDTILGERISKQTNILYVKHLIIIERLLAECTIWVVIRVLCKQVYYFLSLPLSSLSFSSSSPYSLKSGIFYFDQLYLEPCQVGLHHTFCMRGHHAMFADIDSMLKAELVCNFPFRAFAQPHRKATSLERSANKFLLFIEEKLVHCSFSKHSVYETPFSHSVVQGSL